MPSMDWVRAITFDFWGTLVDVDASGRDGMALVLDEVGRQDLDPLDFYLRWDAATVRRYRSDVWRPYIEWNAMGLRDVLKPLIGPGDDAQWAKRAEILVSTMTREARPHPEVSGIIAGLKARYPLMPITNMHTPLFRLNDSGRQFERVLTAQDAGAFKPSALIFRRAIELLDVPPANILHVSLSQFVDLEGAMPVGMRVAWINRGGETLNVHTPTPLFESPDLNGIGRMFGLCEGYTW